MLTGKVASVGGPLVGLLRKSTDREQKEQFRLFSPR